MSSTGTEISKRFTGAGDIPADISKGLDKAYSKIFDSSSLLLEVTINILVPSPENSIPNEVVVGKDSINDSGAVLTVLY